MIASLMIRASTLIETLVAMGLLGCVLATSGLIYATIFRGDRSLMSTRLELAFDRWLRDVAWEEVRSGGHVTLEGYELLITMDPMSDGFHVHVETIAGGRDHWTKDVLVRP